MLPLKAGRIGLCDGLVFAAQVSDVEAKDWGRGERFEEMVGGTLGWLGI